MEDHGESQTVETPERDATHPQRSVYQFSEMVIEWKGFTLRAFLTGLIFSLIPALYDFVVDNLLGWEYFSGRKTTYHTDNLTFIPETCFLQQNNTSNLTYDCIHPPNLLYGYLTLLIPFLPGIQWYSSLQVEKKYMLAKFMSSLLFPIFMIVFKVRLIITLYCWFLASLSNFLPK